MPLQRGLFRVGQGIHVAEVRLLRRPPSGVGRWNPLRIWNSPIYTIDLSSPKDYIENPGSLVPPRVVTDFPLRKRVADQDSAVLNW
jgi:hypothetical protein